MHPEAFAFVTGAVAGNIEPEDMAGMRILEIGSYNVNGSVRPLFQGCAEYVGIDGRPGPDVDVVIQADDYTGTGFDVVVCCEVLEHDPAPVKILDCAWRALAPGGMLILTAAGPGRAPHGCDGMAVQPGECYANIEPGELEWWLDAKGWQQVEVRANPAAGDVYATALKPVVIE